MKVHYFSILSSSTKHFTFTSTIISESKYYLLFLQFSDADPPNIILFDVIFIFFRAEHPILYNLNAEENKLWLMAGGESVLCEAARNRNLEQVGNKFIISDFTCWLLGEAADQLWGQCQSSGQAWRDSSDHCIMSGIYRGGYLCVAWSALP